MVREYFYEIWVRHFRGYHIDRFGLCVDKDQDAANTPLYEGLIAFIAYFYDRPDFKTRLIRNWGKIRTERHSYRRHPNQSSWESYNNNFSPDQCLPLIMAFGAWELYPQIREVLYGIFKRFGFYWNTRRNAMWATLAEHTAKSKETKDWNYSFKMPSFFWPNHWGVFIRALRFYPLYPVLLLTDTVLLYLSIKSILKSYFDSDYADDVLLILCLVQGKNFLPTPWISFCVFITQRKLQPGRHKRPFNPVWNGVQASFYWKFRKNYPPFGLLYHHLLKEQF